VRIGRYHLEVWDRVPSAGLCVTSAAGSVEGSWKDGAQVIPLFRVPAIDAAAAAERIRDVLASGYTGEGARCLEFEEALARELRMRVLYVNSCTSALRLAYHLAGARREKEVISTPVTSLATNTAIIETGARIVWADVDPVTGNIDPDDVLRKVSPRTVAVAAVDWGGRLCAYDRLRAGLRGPAIVEDAAHAFGADRGPGPVSERRGDFVCFSFQSIKHVSTADGGALACPSDALRERARLLRWFGLDRSRGSSMRCYQSVSEAGFKMQGNDVLATLGIEGLRGAPTVLARCRANAAFYGERLNGVRHVKLAPPDPGASWWFFGIRVSQPIRFAAFMAERGAEVAQVSARCDSQPCFDGAVSGPLPGVDDFYAHQVNLPCGAHVTPGEAEEVARAVEAWSDLAEARW
jgi:dTDP-4-amino-4,6-dideoxygalactose transaminase